MNFLSALVTAFITLSYLVLYTPMKPRSSLCMLVGAVPGALPPVIGWVAARGDFDTAAWVLFAIMFLWQIPHTLAIARLYRDDYAKAGIQFLPVIEPDGGSTNRQIVSHCAALLAVSLLPTLLGLAGGDLFHRRVLLGCRFSRQRDSPGDLIDAHPRPALALCVVDLFTRTAHRDGADRVP